ncbi:MAG TPA: zf-HC2 domain-containing protein [Vicinamibacterales bacterium]
MCNKEQLVALLYDDLNDMDRAKVEMHLRACEPCREELAALRGVRVDLAAWTPAMPDLGFRIVRDVKPATRPSWRAWWTPAAGLAAAAALVLAAALSIAHVEIHRGPDGITVRTGWPTSAPAVAASNVGVPRAMLASDVFVPNDQINPAGLAGIVQRIDALEATLKQAPLTRNASMVSARASDEEMIKRVREMLAQSEAREQGELALRIGQVIRDFDNLRRADMASIQTGLARLDANMTKAAELHADLVSYVTTTAGKQK